MCYTKKDFLGTRNLSKDEILYFIERAKEFKILNQSKNPQIYLAKVSLMHFLKIQLEREFHLKQPKSV